MIISGEKNVQYLFSLKDKNEYELYVIYKGEYKHLTFSSFNR